MYMGSVVNISGFPEKEKEKTVMKHFGLFLVTELHSKEGEAPKRGLWAVHSTGPPSSRGRFILRSMTGVVLWTRPLHPRVRYVTSLFPGPLFVQGPTWGPLLKTAIKIKRRGVRSSHIVNLKADVELRVVG